MVRLAVERINIIVEVILVDNINHVLVRGHFGCYMTTVCVVMMLLFTMAGRVHGVFVIAHGLNIAVIIIVVIDYTMSWLVSRVIALVWESMEDGVLVIVHRLNVTLIIVVVIKRAMSWVICRVVPVIVSVSV